MAFDLNEARAYVKSVDLSGTPRAIVPMDAAGDAGEVFDSAKNQAQVVGSSLLSFAAGVDPKIRESISDSALLAQLVANKKAGSIDSDPLAWYGHYVTVLQNVGWVIQEFAWTDYSTQGTGAEVKQQVLDVLAIALGPAATAAAIVKAALDMLASMKEDGSWFTIFSHEAQHATMARFQVGLVETGADDSVFVSLLACLVKAQKTLTQVLFFKFRQEKASFDASSAKVSINRAALTDLGPAIRTKVRAYQNDYLSSIVDL
jgi:hypothetical protein